MFIPNYNHIVSAARNIKPVRLPLYEHIISPKIMEHILGEEFSQYESSVIEEELAVFFKHYCRFFKEMTYDTVSYEYTITKILPAKGEALRGRRQGPIQTRSDFNSVDWDGLVKEYIRKADIKFRVLGRSMPEGMKAVGGIGNGVFEISQDLVGMEYLSYMQVDDPELFADIFKKIGDLMFSLWQWFLKTHSDNFCLCRFGDDLGYKSGTLISPKVIREHIIPQYKRIVDAVHLAGRPFLWHSCGCIFEIFDDVINIGIDAKHSNEDSIAPYSKWIDNYSDHIGLFGGIDVNLLCLLSPEEIFDTVVRLGTEFRKKAKGYALGSGNSIPDYVPIESYLAMIRAVQEIRRREELE